MFCKRTLVDIIETISVRTRVLFLFRREFCTLQTRSNIRIDLFRVGLFVVWQTFKIFSISIVFKCLIMACRWLLYGQNVQLKLYKYLWLIQYNT